MRRRLGLLTLILALVALVAGTAYAEVEEVDEGPEPRPTAETAEIGEMGDWWFSYDDGEMVKLVYWLPPVPLDGWVEPGCATGHTLTDPLPEDCYDVSVAGPNGQTNHGSFVSAFVHSLKDSSFARDTHGPKGQFVREIAGSDLGKNGDTDGAELEPLDADSDEDGDGPPAHAKAHGNKKEKNGGG